MRYWDIGQQLYPAPRFGRVASHWRRLVRRFVDDHAIVDEDAINVDVAGAMTRNLHHKPNLLAGTWPSTVHCIGSLGAGGAERQLVNLLINLAHRGHHDQTLLTMHALEGDGAHYLPLLTSHHVNTRVNNQPIRQEGVELIRNNEEIVRLIQQMPESFNTWTFDLWVEIALLKPEVAHFWLDHCNIWGAPAALLAGVPAVVLSTRNVHPENFPYLYAPYMRPWYRWLAQCSRVHFINNSHAGADSYAEWIGVPTAHIEVIVNGVHLEHLTAACPDVRRTTRDEIGLPQDAVVIAGAFRLSEEKRPLLFVDTFAEAARTRPDLHAVLMGEGPLFDAVAARAKELGVGERLRLLGRRGDLPRVLSSMDVLLHTAWWEGTPNVVLEAQQLQLPVVVARAGGAADAVDHGVTGFLVDREDTAALVDRLEEVLDNLEAWKVRAQRGPTFIAERFGVERMVDATVSMHHAILETKGAASAPAATGA